MNPVNVLAPEEADKSYEVIVALVKPLAVKPAAPDTVTVLRAASVDALRSNALEPETVNDVRPAPVKVKSEPATAPVSTASDV